MKQKKPTFLRKYAVKEETCLHLVQKPTQKWSNCHCAAMTDIVLHNA